MHAGDAPNETAKPEVQAADNLKAVGAAVRLYMLYNDGQRPDRISRLYEDGLILDPQMFVRPGSDKRVRDAAGIEELTDYTLPDKTSRDTGMPLLWERETPAANRPAAYYRDGSVRSFDPDSGPVRVAIDPNDGQRQGRDNGKPPDHAKPVEVTKADPFDGNLPAHPVRREPGDGRSLDKPSTQPAITFDEVLSALRFEVAEETILERLRTSPTRFTLGKAQIERLKEAGATERVIQAMIAGEKPIARLPDGIGVGEGLEVTRWASYRLVTRFNKDLWTRFLDTRISGDGSRIALATEHGVWIVGADGTGLQRLSETRVGHGGVDVSVDGSTIAWHDAKGAYVYNVEEKQKATMPEGIGTWSLRLSGDGKWLFLWDYGTGSLFRLASDGSDVRKIMTNGPPAELSGHPVNRNLWGAGLQVGPDVSHDAARVAFSYGGEAFVINGDGGGLRMLTNNRQQKRLYMNYVKISGDGRRVSWHYPTEHRFVIADLQGNLIGEHDGVTHVDRARLTRDGRWLSIGRGWRLLSADGSQRMNLTHVGHNYPRAVSGASMTSISDDGRRACMMVTAKYGEINGYQQVLVVDLYPESLAGLPKLENVRVVPRSMPNDGSERATLTVKATDESLDVVMGFLMKDDYYGATSEYGAVHAFDDGVRYGDETAEDGVFTSNQLHLRPSDPDRAVPPGPVNLRVYAVNREGNMLLVDIAGLESRSP